MQPDTSVIFVGLGVIRFGLRATGHLHPVDPDTGVIYCDECAAAINADLAEIRGGAA